METIGPAAGHEGSVARTRAPGSAPCPHWTILDSGGTGLAGEQILYVIDMRNALQAKREWRVTAGYNLQPTTSSSCAAPSRMRRRDSGLRLAELGLASRSAGVVHAPHAGEGRRVDASSGDRRIRRDIPRRRLEATGEAFVFSGAGGGRRLHRHLPTASCGRVLMSFEAVARVVAGSHVWDIPWRRGGGVLPHEAGHTTSGYPARVLDFCRTLQKTPSARRCTLRILNSILSMEVSARAAHYGTRLE